MRSSASVKAYVKEFVVEHELVQRVEALGGMCEKVTVIGSRGFFDRLVVLPGRIIFVEVKRPRGGSLSAHQRQRIATYKRLGVAVAVVRNSADIDAILK